MWRKKILPYFQYSRKERTGILFLIVIIILLWVIPIFFASDEKPLSDSELKMIELANQLNELEDESFSASSIEEKKLNEPSKDISFNSVNGKRLYPFDPNTAKADVWITFGLKPKTISIIQNYLSKGGRFRQPEDVGKVYGLKPEEFRRLLPFIRIKDSKERQATYTAYSPEPDKNQSSATDGRLFRGRLNAIEINTADSSEWESLPGIGLKLSSRILKFRNQLGGFHSIDQVGETFGLQDSVFRKIKPLLRLDKDPGVRKLFINKMSGDELDLHPYISGKLASVIVAYRHEHGPFHDPGDLKNIALMTDDLLIKIQPYLDFSN